MIDSNNLNILPWYDSLDKQDYKKWYAFGQIWPLICPATSLLPFQFIYKGTISSISTLSVYRLETGETIATNIQPVHTNYTDEGFALVMVSPTSNAFGKTLEQGQYYAKLTINDSTVYSEVFTVMSDVSRCIKLEYWNDEDLKYKDGVISYVNDFKYIAYVQSTIGKPTYEFEEELTKRAGYKFLESQVVNKVYNFTFIAPEFICDAMRLLRMSDYVKITSPDDSFNSIYLSYEVDWQDQGNLAAVKIEFETDTIIQKLSGFNKRDLAGFYNALLVDINEPMLFDVDVVAQYYDAYVSNKASTLAEEPVAGQVSGKLIRELDELADITEDIDPFVPIDLGTGPARKYRLKKIFNDIASDKFLRKDKEDITNYLLRLLGGIITDNIASQNLVLGPLGTGFLIKVDPATGRSYIETDELYVRLKAYFDTLEIKHISHVGGTIIISPASMECNRVELINSEEGDPLYDSLNSRLKDSTSSNLFAKFLGRVTQSVYRCYFNNTDGTKEIVNEFAVDDLAQCRTFNVKEGVSENVSNQYYWRRVVAVGDNYIDLSVSDCDPLSTVPQAGDTIVTIGNKTDVRRQNVIMLMAFGEGSPAIYQYSGINSYSLVGKAKTIISPERNEFRGTFYFESGENVKDFITITGDTIKTEVSESIFQILPDKITLEVSKQISTVVDDVDTLKTQVSSLEIKSDEISLEVSSIESTANSALDKAETAESTANTVKSEVSSIKVQIGSISLEVSSVESTANSAYNKATSAQSTANSAYNKADDAQDTANSAYDKADGAQSTANSAITQISSLKVEVGNITSTVSKFEDGDELVSIINQTATSIKLSAQRINLSGAISANGTFSISTAGYVTCTGGTIGGFTIGSNKIEYTSGSNKVSLSTSGLIIESYNRGFQLSPTGFSLTGSMNLILLDDCLIDGLAVSVGRGSNANTNIQSNCMIFDSSSPTSIDLYSREKTGFVLFVKNTSTTRSPILNGSFRDATGNYRTNFTIADRASRIFVYDGVYWNEFYCTP